MKVESGTSQLASWQLWDSGRACCSFYLLKCTELRLSEISGDGSGKPGCLGYHACEACILDRNSTAEELWVLEEPDRVIGVTGTYLKPFSYSWSVEHSLLSACSHESECAGSSRFTMNTPPHRSPSNTIGSAPVIHHPVSRSSPSDSMWPACTTSLSLFPHWSSFACDGTKIPTSRCQCSSFQSGFCPSQRITLTFFCGTGNNSKEPTQDLSFLISDKPAYMDQAPAHPLSPSRLWKYACPQASP